MRKFIARFGRAIALSFAAIAAIVGGLAVLAIGLLYAIGSAMVAERDIATIYSPDDKTIAIVEEVNGGATTSFGYNIYLRANSRFGFRREAASFYGPLRSECAYGVDAIWQSDNQIQIRYFAARYEPSYKHSLLVGTKWVQVELVSGVSSPNAPCSRNTENPDAA